MKLNNDYEVIEAIENSSIGKKTKIIELPTNQETASLFR
tara:strand:- start:869 stop:985 length:117 start_codon:yes stop_codon:yes gene_type:complete